jgi:tRNA threonylcarbamoyl adenosine modification protein YeaZ
MAAKALAWGAGVRLAAVSSLAALAQTAMCDKRAREGDFIYVVQDARRDEVYAGLYRVEDGEAVPQRGDAALTPEEAAALLAALDREHGSRLRLAGSSFTTYAAVLGGLESGPGRVDPAAVGRLGWRQSLREQTADPFALQPVYLRRDADADWRHDHLIAPEKENG